MNLKSMTCLLAIFATHLTLVCGQFGGFFPNRGRPFFSNAGGSSGQFSNQNTNFQQSNGGSFGVIEAFGSGHSNTNFQQQNSNAGNFKSKYAINIFLFRFSTRKQLKNVFFIKK